METFSVAVADFFYFARAENGFSEGSGKKRNTRFHDDFIAESREKEKKASKL